MPKQATAGNLTSEAHHGLPFDSDADGVLSSGKSNRMCTLTILRQPGRVVLTMNRDDVASRPEQPPSIWPEVHPSFIAPRDMRAGGTWIAVNAHGVAGCLLNRYDVAPVGRRSRGAIVPEAMRGASVDDACRLIEDLSLADYSPFTCVLVSLTGAARLDWTGERLECAALASDTHAMLTSSSWRPEDVRAQRARLFQRAWSQALPIEDWLADFHCHLDVAEQHWRPMMRRETSETKSVTQIEIDARADMRYWSRESAVARQLKSPDIGIALPIHPHTS